MTSFDVRTIMEFSGTCRTCAYLAELIDEDENGYYILAGDIKGDDVHEHFQQLGVDGV